jgi:uncharacterized protein (TIRG00374 family)
MTKAKNKFNQRFIAVALLLAIGLYILLPQFGSFKSSFRMLSHPEYSWLAGALVFISVTYLAAGGTYYLLAFKKLKYWRTVLVELAAMFVNRLLPGGVGALGANFIYLKRNHNNTGQASTIVAINNLLGFAGHALLTFIILIAYTGHTAKLQGIKDHSWSTTLAYILPVILLLGVILAIFARDKIKNFIAETGRQLAGYRRQPWKLIAAFATSMILTLCNVFCLYFCMQAVGVSLSFLAVFLIFSFAVSAGTATPTPGGLGGYEAALTAGFVAYGVPNAAALAIALLYRLISYWLPLLAGSVAFIFSQRRRYI